MAKRLNVELAFTANTGQAKAQIASLQQSLNQLLVSGKTQNSLGIDKELTEATHKATQLKAILASSTTNKGTLDLGKFNAGLKESRMTIQQYGSALSKLGPQGRAAFQQLANAVSVSTVSMKQANTMLSEMWTTMKNTVRWQLTSSTLHSFIGGLHEAYGYAKNLNKTLTDIRIVAPEKTMEDMAKFSKLANQQAKQLSTTTLDYAKGALIYYQQGLDDVQVKARTDVTTMMSNVTGDSTDDVSSYMTAIWNNFNKAGDESEEHFADILTRLGADSAASTSEITRALEKYSGVASTIGLSYEAATAAATTLIDRLRETPEVAGTALKTVFARLEGLKQGETLEDDTDLNKYSQGLANVGVNIKDANGELKDMDTIIDEVGNAWQSLDKDQKVALAQTVAGIRQWNQFAALMDNFDVYKQFKEDAESASGSLQEQQDIYAESWEAAANRLKAAFQEIYAAVFDDKFFIAMTNGLATIVDGIGNLVTGMGGLKTLLPLIIALMLKLFGTEMAGSLNNFVEKIKMTSSKYRQEIAQLKKDTNNVAANQAANTATISGLATDVFYKKQAELNNQLIDKTEELAKMKKGLTENEKEYAKAALDTNNALGEQYIKESELAEESVKNSEQDKKRINKIMENAAYKELGGHAANKDDRKQIRADARELTGLNQNTINDAIDMTRTSAFIDESSSLFDGADDKIIGNKAQDMIEKLTNHLGDIAPDSKEAKNAISEFVQELEGIKSAEGDLKKIEEHLNKIAQLKEKINSKADDKLNEMEQDMVDSGVDIDKAQKERQQVEEQATKTGQQFGKKIKAEFNFETNAEEIKKRFAALKGAGASVIGVLERSAQAAANLAMGISAVTNAYAVLNDEEATTTEKTTSVLMAIGMMVPALVSLGNIIHGITLSGAKSFAASMLRAMGYEAEAKSALKAKGATALLGVALGPIILPLLAIISALTMFGILAKQAYDMGHALSQNYDEMAENADRAADNLNNVSNAVNDLNNSMDSLDSKRDALKNMTVGTSEWSKAVNDLNSNVMESIENFNDLNNGLSDKDLDKINKNLSKEEKKQIAGGAFDSADMKLNEDYFYDSQGVLQITASGQIKMDKVQSILINNATINANQSKMIENQAERGKNKEEFLRNQKSVSHSEEYLKSQRDSIKQDYKSELPPQADEAFTKQITQGYAKRMVPEEGTVTGDTYSALMQAIQTGELTTGQFSSADALEEVLTEYGIDGAASQADLIASNSEVIEALTSDANALVANTEALNASIAQTIAADERVQDKLYGENSVLSKEDQEKFGSVITLAMAQDTNTMTQNYMGASQDWKTQNLYGGKKWQDYREDYAEQNNLVKKNNQFYEQDENGEATGKAVKIQQNMVDAMLAENKAREDIIDNMDTYIQQTKKNKENLEGYERLKDTWNELGEEMKKTNRTITEHTKKVDKNSDKYKSACKSMDKYAKTIRKDFGDILDMDLDETLFDGQFVHDNFADIEAAMDGDVEAAERVRQAYGDLQFDKLIDEKGIPKLGEQMGYELEDLKNMFNNFQNELAPLEPGADLSGYRAALNELINATCTTEEEAQAVLESLGVDAEVTTADPEEIEVPSSSQDMEPVEMGSVTLPNYAFKSSIQKTADGATGTAGWEQSGGGTTVTGIGWKPGNKTTTLDKRTSPPAFGLKVMPGGSGKITKKGTNSIKSGGIRPRGGGSGGRGGGGGGGRGGGRRRTRAEHQQREKKIDPYKQVTKNIEKLARATSKAKDNNEKLYGKKQLNNMEEVNAKLRDELKAIQKKNDLTSKYISLNRTRLKDELNYWQKILGKNGSKVVKNLSKGPDFTFDEFGNISNYNKVMDRYQTARDKLIDEMNKKKTKEAQDKFKEKYLDPLDQAIDGINSQVEEYESHIETHLQEIDDWSDKFNEVLENIYEHANTQVELNLTVNDNASKLVDYYVSKLEDDVYKIGELYDKMFGEQNSQYANILDKMDIYLNKTYAYTDAAQKYTTEGTYFEYYEKLYKSGQITQANYVEAMQKGYDELIDSASSLLDLQKEMDDYYLNAIDLIRQKLEPYYNSIAGGVEALEHWKNVIDLTGNGKDYNQLINVQSKLLDLTRQRYNFAVQERDKQQEIYRNFSEQYKNELSDDYALSGITEEQHDWAIKQAEDMASTLQERNQEVADSAEDLLNAGKEQLELTIEQARRDIEEFLSGVEGGFEQLQKQMSLSSTRQEEYLTKTNQVYEMNKMLRTLRSDIDKTDNKAAKQRLSNFSKELDNLKEKDRLSNLELKIAQAKYEQLKAQIALEEAQNAKSVVRLSRDNEGNYGYVYTANKEDVDKAQEELDNANNSLYNILLEANNDYNEKIINYVSQMLDEIDAIRNNSELSDEEKDDLINAIRNKYSAILNDAEQLLGIATSGLTNEFNAFQEAWSNEYAKNVTDMLEAIKNQAIDNWENIIKDEYDQFAQLGSGIADTDLEAINSALQLAYDAVSKLGEKGGLLNAYSNLDETLEKMDEYIKEIPKIEEKIGNIEDTLEVVKKILDNQAYGKTDETYYDYNKLLRYIAELNSSSVDQLDSGAVDFSASGKSIGKNPSFEQNEKAKKIWQQIEMGARGWLGLDESGNLTAAYNVGGRTDSEAYADSKKKLAKAIYQFDTGGYTGAWGSEEGKLAMLHEKELVLNAQDTKNMLETVDIVRSIVNAIDTNVLSIGANLSSAGVPQTGGELNQNVSISAEFPAVQDRHEIEAAFDNLINRAAQFANRTR